MKKIIYFIVIVAIISAVFAICGNRNKNRGDLWENATYMENTQLGEGEGYFDLKVTAGEKNLTFRVKTDRKTVGEALEEVKLISGEKGAYGLYVKKVNGIIADYNTTKSYWSFYKDGEYSQTGIDKTEFENGDTFELVYTEA